MNSDRSLQNRVLAWRQGRLYTFAISTLALAMVLVLLSRRSETHVVVSATFSQQTRSADHSTKFLKDPRNMQHAVLAAQDELKGLLVEKTSQELLRGLHIETAPGPNEGETHIVVQLKAKQPQVAVVVLQKLTQLMLEAQRQEITEIHIRAEKAISLGLESQRQEASESSIELERLLARRITPTPAAPTPIAAEDPQIMALRYEVARQQQRFNKASAVQTPAHPENQDLRLQLDHAKKNLAIALSERQPTPPVLPTLKHSGEMNATPTADDFRRVFKRLQAAQNNVAPAGETAEQLSPAIFVKTPRIESEISRPLPATMSWWMITLLSCSWGLLVALGVSRRTSRHSLTTHTEVEQILDLRVLGVTSSGSPRPSVTGRPPRRWSRAILIVNEGLAVSLLALLAF